MFAFYDLFFVGLAHRKGLSAGGGEKVRELPLLRQSGEASFCLRCVGDLAEDGFQTLFTFFIVLYLSLIHISEPTRH